MWTVIWKGFVFCLPVIETSTEILNCVFHALPTFTIFKHGFDIVHENVYLFSLSFYNLLIRRFLSLIFFSKHPKLFPTKVTFIFSSGFLPSSSTALTCTSFRGTSGKLLKTFFFSLPLALKRSIQILCDIWANFENQIAPIRDGIKFFLKFFFRFYVIV